MFYYIFAHFLKKLNTKMEFPDGFNTTISEILLNKSGEVDPELYDRYLLNRAIDDPAYTILIILYCLLIAMGTIGNILVIIAVFKKPTMRTPRNMFIVNLAVSDLLLCCITMPLTLMEILTKYFPLGNSLFVCKTIGILQATSIYVSTISIAAIALDRYQVILYPTKESLQLFGATLILLLIWVFALTLAMPLFIIKHLEHHDINIGGMVLNIDYCIENWPIDNGRAYYSFFSIIFQYSLPIIIVTAAYYKISYKLRYRFQAGFVSTEDNLHRNRRQLRGRRLQRTNLVLGSIAVIFCISWLPLNLFNLIADLSSDPKKFSSQSMKVCYAICHMMGMSSACSNPILYGCLNENFWKEFKEILCIEKNVGDLGQVQKLSVRKKCQNNLLKADLMTDATNNYQQCNTVSSDLTVLTKC